MTPSRREFICQGVTTGFALAVLPVTSWAVSTSKDGIVDGPVKIPVGGAGGETMPGYRAMPKGKGPFPTVLVVHEIFGVHEYIQDVCRRLAQEGYAAVAPYLYFREGDVAQLKSIDEIRAKVVSKVDPQRVLKDLDAVVKWLDETKTADPARLAITGFCWGGTVAWTYSEHNPKLKAGIAWYGKLSAPVAGGHNPLELAPELKVPVLGLYGGKDAGIPVADVDKMRAALSHGKSGSEMIVYPEAEHGFHADYRPSYHEKSAREGWTRMLEWLRKHGVK